MIVRPKDLHNYLNILFNLYIDISLFFIFQTLIIVCYPGIVWQLTASRLIRLPFWDFVTDPDHYLQCHVAQYIYSQQL